MKALSLDLDAHSVLDRYLTVPQSAGLQRLGNHGGFSGACLWKVDLAGATYILKAWPENGIAGKRLAWIHQLIRTARSSGLMYVPAVLPTQEGVTYSECARRLWDLTSLVTGSANFHDAPGEKRLRNACFALAEIHATWSSMATSSAACPGVRTRLRRIRGWTTLTRSGWKPCFTGRYVPALHILCERAWRLLPSYINVALRQLEPWEDRLLPLQPCLRDIWHDHVFFIGEKVTGIIDFGSVKIDHVAADLARLLGSMVEDDSHLRAAGLEAYSQVHPLSEQDVELVTILDKTGTVASLMNWLKWLYHDHREFDDLRAVAQRIEALVRRVVGWSGT